MPFVITDRCFSGSEAVKSGLLHQHFDRRAKRDALGIKTLRSLLITWYRNEFCSRMPHNTRVKFIRNESFLNGFIGVFTPERNIHSCTCII